MAQEPAPLPVHERQLDEEVQEEDRARGRVHEREGQHDARRRREGRPPRAGSRGRRRSARGRGARTRPRGRGRTARLEARLQVALAALVLEPTGFLRQAPPPRGVRLRVRRVPAQVVGRRAQEAGRAVGARRRRSPVRTTSGAVEELARVGPERRAAGPPRVRAIGANRSRTFSRAVARGGSPIVRRRAIASRSIADASPREREQRVGLDVGGGPRALVEGADLRVEVSLDPPVGRRGGVREAQVRRLGAPRRGPATHAPTNPRPAPAGDARTARAPRPPRGQQRAPAVRRGRLRGRPRPRRARDRPAASPGGAGGAVGRASSEATGCSPPASSRARRSGARSLRTDSAADRVSTRAPRAMEAGGARRGWVRGASPEGERRHGTRFGPEKHPTLPEAASGSWQSRRALAALLGGRGPGSGPRRRLRRLRGAPRRRSCRSWPGSRSSSGRPTSARLGTT